MYTSLGNQSNGLHLLASVSEAVHDGFALWTSDVGHSLDEREGEGEGWSGRGGVGRSGVGGVEGEGWRGWGRVGGVE